MGLNSFGAPHSFVLNIKEMMGSVCFVETGTHVGGTSSWASSHFSKVITIEASLELYEAAAPALSGLTNVDRYLGGSPQHLRSIVPSLPKSIFWLDAHWSTGNTAGEENECPILAELSEIVPYMQNHVVLIDDARYFVNPPPAPHQLQEWPSLDDIFSVMRMGGQTYTIIIQDVIAIFPVFFREKVSEMVRSLSK